MLKFDAFVKYLTNMIKPIFAKYLTHPPHEGAHGALLIADRHRLHGYLAQRVPSLSLASTVGNCLKLCSSDMYVSLAD